MHLSEFVYWLTTSVPWVSWSQPQFDGIQRWK